MQTAPTPVLITIPISHYCEKARWALERAGIPYRERRHMQGWHRVATKRAANAGTAPVLLTAEGPLTESADILRYADERAPAGKGLYPEDAAQRAEIHALERDYDERLGPEGRLWMYQEIGRERQLILDYGRPGVPRWQSATLPVLLPVMSRFIDRVLDITPETAKRAERNVDDTFDEVAERLADGRPYLAGDTFTGADLTFAALSAAVLAPPEYGVTLPQPDELPPRAATRVREWREHPAGAFALRMFREHRH